MIIPVNFQLKQLERRSLKKNQGFNVIRTRDLRDTGAMLNQLNYEAIHCERDQLVMIMIRFTFCSISYSTHENIWALKSHGIPVAVLTKYRS